jgi:hypothetical protein
MQYGLSLPNGRLWGDARTLADLSQLAEDSSWDRVLGMITSRFGGFGNRTGLYQKGPIVYKVKLS